MRYHVAMSYRPPDELIIKWRAELAAFYDEQKRAALEDFDQRWSKSANDEKGPPIPSTAQRTSVSLQENTPKSNGSSATAARTPTRKQMVLEVMPEFRGDTFTRADVEAKILEKYPNAEAPYLSSSISNLLKEMVEKDRLERVDRGERIQDPVIYRAKESGEENLLES